MKTKHVIPHGGPSKWRAVPSSSSSAVKAVPTQIAGRHGVPGSAARSKSKSSRSSHGAGGGNGHRNGHGHGNGAVLTPARARGHGHAPGAGAGPVKPRASAVAPGVAQPTYDSGARYDTPGLHYAADPEPTTPPPMGAKVRLELFSRTDANLAAFGEAHVAAMLNNANFPTPTPSTAVFGQYLSDFEAILSQYEAAKVALKNLTEQKDALRAAFCAVFTQRAQYVEVASNGDPDIIATSALPLRRAPTPVGALSWPLNLRVDQSNNPGELLVKWAAVSAARGYVLQCAEVIADQPRQWVQAYTGGKPTSAQKTLTPGKFYEFRVAAIGGSTGQSDWSPVVARMAA